MTVREVLQKELKSDDTRDIVISYFHKGKKSITFKEYDSVRLLFLNDIILNCEVTDVYGNYKEIYITIDCCDIMANLCTNFWRGGK